MARSKKHVISSEAERSTHSRTECARMNGMRFPAVKSPGREGNQCGKPLPAQYPVTKHFPSAPSLLFPLPQPTPCLQLRVRGSLDSLRSLEMTSFFCSATTAPRPFLRTYPLSSPAQPRDPRTPGRKTAHWFPRTQNLSSRAKPRDPRTPERRSARWLSRRNHLPAY